MAMFSGAAVKRETRGDFTSLQFNQSLISLNVDFSSHRRKIMML